MLYGKIIQAHIHHLCASIQCYFFFFHIQCQPLWHHQVCLWSSSKPSFITLVGLQGWIATVKICIAVRYWLLALVSGFLKQLLVREMVDQVTNIRTAVWGIQILCTKFEAAVGYLKVCQWRPWHGENMVDSIHRNIIIQNR